MNLGTLFLDMFDKNLYPALYTENLSDEQRAEVAAALDPRGRYAENGGLDKIQMDTGFNQWQVKWFGHGWFIKRKTWSQGGKYCADYETLLRVAREYGGG